ncbi:hypothetical protein E2C01_062930 [Portunus trituberculatus]|uniref:Uncharacterized protein n=1 Tax=Portunus trituberculatus TaxID=210409 RepID=A0A5B7HJG0_PORTR|nr:hypothetical protein [Portunus trituberculatus]
MPQELGGPELLRQRWEALLQGPCPAWPLSHFTRSTGPHETLRKSSPASFHSQLNKNNLKQQQYQQQHHYHHDHHHHHSTPSHAPQLLDKAGAAFLC